MSYYLRTLPTNLQHPPPVVLLPQEWLWLQLASPFLPGGLLGAWVLRQAARFEQRRAQA